MRKPLRSKTGADQRENGTTQPLDIGGDSQSGGEAFGPGTILLIYVNETQKPLQIEPPDRDELLIGRSAPDSILIPDIDLAVAGGSSQGISRVHAMLALDGERLTLTDLGSTNGTFINGQKLHPHEVRILLDSDEVRFANLTTYVRFHTPE